MNNESEAIVGCIVTCTIVFIFIAIGFALGYLYGVDDTTNKNTQMLCKQIAVTTEQYINWCQLPYEKVVSKIPKIK